MKVYIKILLGILLIMVVVGFISISIDKRKDNELIELYNNMNQKDPLCLLTKKDTVAYLLNIVSIDNDTLGEGEHLLQYEKSLLSDFNYQKKELENGFDDMGFIMRVHYTPNEVKYSEMSSYHYHYKNGSYKISKISDNENYEWKSGDLDKSVEHRNVLKYYKKNKSEIPAFFEDSLANIYIDITHLLSIEQFEDITKFVLDQGQTQIWSSLYGSSPYYKFEYFSLLIEQINDLSYVPDPGAITLHIQKPRRYPFKYSHQISIDREKRKVYLYGGRDARNLMRITYPRYKAIEHNISVFISEIQGIINAANHIDITHLLSVEQFYKIKKSISDQDPYFASAKQYENFYLYLSPFTDSDVILLGIRSIGDYPFSPAITIDKEKKTVLMSLGWGSEYIIQQRYQIAEKHILEIQQTLNDTKNE